MIATILWFIGGKEERFILAIVKLGNNQWSAERSMELVILQRRLGSVVCGQSEWRSSERWVAVVPKRRPVILIGARFRGGIDYTATRCPIFSRVSRGLHRELLHRFRSEANHGAGQTDARVVRSIGHNQCA